MLKKCLIFVVLLLLVGCGTTLKNVRKYQEQRDVEKLIAALKERNWGNRIGMEAAKALGEIKDPRAVEPLIAALKDDEGWCWVQIEAAKALVKIKDPRAVEPLIAALKDDDLPSVQMEAAKALGELKDPRAVEPLIAAVKPESWIWDARSETLDPLYDLRPVEALRKITGKDFGYDQAKWREWWEQNKGNFLKSR